MESMDIVRERIETLEQPMKVRGAYLFGCYTNPRNRREP
jgi:hypothetical protein